MTHRTGRLPRSIHPACALALLVACAPPPVSESLPGPPTELPVVEVLAPAEVVQGHPTGSTAMVAGPDQGLYAVDPDSGTVVYRNSELDGAELRVGSEPSRIARVGEDLYVTLRGEGAVVRIGLDGEEHARAQVGLEPIGVVARSDGRRVFVAASLSGTVLELDGTTLETVRTWDLGGEPRWLALTPDATALYVASLIGPDPVTRIDLVTGEVQGLALPTPVRTLNGDEVLLGSRVTGDPWYSARLGALAVPVLFVDTLTPVTQEGEDVSIGAGVFIGEGYGSGATPVDPAAPVVGKLTPAIVLFPEVGVPRALFASGRISVGGEILLAKSYLQSVGETPSGLLFGAMEASDAVIVMDPDSPLRIPTSPVELALGPQSAGMELVASTLVGTPRPQHVVWTEGGAWSLSPIDLSIRPLPDALIEAEIDLLIDLDSSGMDHDAVSQLAGYTTAWVGARFPDTLNTEVARGRQLFTSAMDPEMSAGGVSCSTCHVDGRTDGLTWTFVNGPRQTPSLAGVVSDTVPLTWNQEVPSVAEEARLTIQHRMGGTGVSDADLLAIERYVDWTRPARRPAADDAATRGQVMFQQLGCGSCHAGTRLTDGSSHVLRGVALNTPSLNGVGASGPWLHDGSAATLREAIDPALNGSMTPAVERTEAEWDDLVAYLQTL